MTDPHPPAAGSGECQKHEEVLCSECHKHRAEVCGYCLAKAEREAARGAAEEQRWADYDEQHNY